MSEMQSEIFRRQISPVQNLCRTYKIHIWPQFFKCSGEQWNFISGWIFSPNESDLFMMRRKFVAFWVMDSCCPCAICGREICHVSCQRKINHSCRNLSFLGMIHQTIQKTLCEPVMDYFIFYWPLIRPCNKLNEWSKINVRRKHIN